MTYCCDLSGVEHLNLKNAKPSQTGVTDCATEGRRMIFVELWAEAPTIARRTAMTYFDTLAHNPQFGQFGPQEPMAHIWLQAVRTVRTADYARGYQSMSSPFSLRWLVPSAQSSTKIMRRPSVAQSVTPVCDGFAFFQIQMLNPGQIAAIGHVSALEARERPFLKATNEWKKHKAGKTKPLRDAGAVCCFLPAIS